MLKYASISKPMFRARGERDFTGQQNRKTKNKAMVDVKQLFNRSPIPTFLRSYFFQREHISHHPSSLPVPSFPPHYHLVSQDTDSVIDQFQLYFITQILLLPRKKSKVKHNLVLLAILAQVSQSTSSDNLTIQQDVHSNMKICLEGNIRMHFFAHIKVQVQRYLMVLS